MKHFLFIALFFVLHGSSLFAQAPQGIPYQAIARNATGSPLATQPISVRFSIHDATATGAVVYQETFSPTTTALGLFNVNVGTGTAVVGTFSSIDWGHNAKFMQVEMDPTGGTSYTDMGTQQMMSVPYALYAGNASNAGGQVLLYSNDFTASGGIVINNTYLTATYRSYMVELSNVTATTNTHLYMQVSVDNGATFLNNTSDYEGIELSNSSIASGAYGMNPGQIDLMLATGSLSTDPGHNYYGSFTLHNINSGNQKMLSGKAFYHQAVGGYLDMQTYEAAISTALPVNALAILPTAGLLSGTIKVYGLN